MTITELMKQLEKISKIVDPNTTSVWMKTTDSLLAFVDPEADDYPNRQVHYFVGAAGLDVQDGQKWGEHEPIVVLTVDPELMVFAYEKGVSGDEIDLETGKVLDPEEKWLKPWKAIKED